MSRLEKTIGARSVQILLIITVLIRFGFAFGSYLLISEQSLNQPEIYYAFIMLQEVVMFGIPLFVFIYLFRPRYTPVLRTQMAYPSLSAALRTILAAVVGAFALNLYIGLWTLLLEALNVQLWLPDVPLPTNGAQIILALVAVAITPAILEELLFRGVLLEGLKRELGPKAAILMTALLFAFMHGSLVGLPAHIALGFVITLLALRQNNLQLPMIYHFSHNAALLIIDIYYNKAMEGIDMEAQAQAMQGANIFPVVLSVLSMALMATFAFWLLIRPLLASSRTQKAVPVLSELSLPQRSRRMVFLLTALLLLLMLPWYVLNFFPA